jgi:hypothetical protein
MTATAAGMSRTPLIVCFPSSLAAAPSQLDLLALLSRYIGEWLAAVDSSSWLMSSRTRRSVPLRAEEASMRVMPS